MTGMIEIRLNKAKNLCYIKLAGYMESDEIIDVKFRAIRAFETLNPEMIIINDISNFKPVREELAQHIAEAQMYAFRKGVVRVIRIVHEPNSQAQFRKTQTESGISYTTIEVNSFTEAMLLVNEEEVLN